jgi:hypothetical protein
MNNRRATKGSSKSVTDMTVSALVLILLILLLVGALPAWPYSRDWGYYPSGGLGVVVLVLVILLLTGRL